MQFDQVAGLAETKNHLKELVQHNRLPHAILLLGREGSGALPLALAFAQYLLCERVNGQPQGTGNKSLFEEAPDSKGIKRTDSCGACAACKRADKLIHPDLHFSYPAIKKDANHTKVLSTDYIKEWREFIAAQPYGNAADWIDYMKVHAKVDNPANKQGNITVQECEDIIHKLQLKSFESDYKVLIMWMPEYLKKEGNRLLKLIEEPPDNTVFLFVAEDEDQIIPTILSRTFLIKIPLPADEEVSAYLAKNNIAQEQAAHIAAASGGNIREALIHSKTAEENWQALIRDWLNITLKNMAAEQIQWIDKMSHLGREKQKSMLRVFIHLLEQTIRWQYLRDENQYRLPEAEQDFVARLAKMCSNPMLEEMVKMHSDAIYYIERNANAKLVFHALTIRMSHLIKDKSLILIQ